MCRTKESYFVIFGYEAGADVVEQLLNEAAEDKHELYINVINAGEVYYMSYRKDGSSKANQVWDAIKKNPFAFC